MKLIKFLLVGFVMGIVMSKSEVISWYRIYEMFRFESFHMYGIIGCAVTIGVTGVWLIKKFKLKDTAGKEIEINDKEKGFVRYIIGGTIFGLGWAMTGACPGPMFTLLGYGVNSIAIVIVSAILGTFIYGVLRSKLPH